MIITALIGQPTSHSVSPELFALYAKEFNLDYSHLKIDVEPKNLSASLQAIKKLNFKGLNVTLPYKSKIMKYVDIVDPEAKAIGAVNTIVNKEGKLYGYNTDSYGAITTIKQWVKNLKGKKVLVLGTGGASRALVFGLLKESAIVTIAFRNPKSIRTKSMFKDFKNKVKFIENSKHNLTKYTIASNIVCNATSCGMNPESNQSPLSPELFKLSAKSSNFSKKLFFDVIFNPYQTVFLKNADKFKANIQGGTEMMIYQGVRAFELWTEHKVSPRTIDLSKVVLKKIIVKKST